MGKKPIAYVLDSFPVLSETFVGTEMRAMIEQGHAVQPIAFHGPSGEFQAADRRLADRTLYLSQIGPNPARVRTAILRLGLGDAAARLALWFLWGQSGLPRRSLLWNAAKLAVAAEAAGCRHLHAHFAGGAAAHALVAARMISASVSFVCHGHDVYSEAQDLPAKLRAADFTVAVCQEMAADLAALEPAAPIAMIPCGIEPGRFNPRPAESADNGRYLFVGRLVEQKGLDDLLAALALIPITRRPALDVVGEGPDGAALRERAASLGLQGRVRFLGARQGSWIAARGPRYRALVGPFKTASTGSRDTGPLVVKEAMAMGLPVVASRFMGVKDTVTPDTGILFEPGNARSLASALVAMEGTPPARRHAMGRAGRIRVLDCFTASRQARTLSRRVDGI